ncbi:unnamed protein product [Arabis nemorensis]|uniref:F-box domain-containing protein n=1 Tax=Arabis nemorensis TaxID=586526 RepID=A0A565CVS4_9BRAS|nr:unnamed protein product [Arabis nemorensis]
MANIPMDIVDDMFHRLPASTLVRFRVLSKPCFSLIDSPEFVASQLKRTLETGDNLMILLRGPRILRTVYLDSPDKVSDVEHPLQAGGLTEVFGSCNGLVGLINSPVDIAIFNPSTRKIHRLPAEPIDLTVKITLEDVFYGLGYDSVNNDYKVVRMVQSKVDRSKKRFPVPFEIKVFSLKRNSWKEIHLRFEVLILFINPYYHLLYRRGNGVLASNSLHWILPRSQGDVAFNTIVRFDLASEELGVVSFPRDLYCEDNMDIGVLDGLLCLMCYEEFSHVDIWVLTEYKGYHSRSWTKMFRVPKPDDVESLELLRPLMYSKDKTKILMEINNAMNLMWFDLESKTLTRVGIKDCDNPYSAEILVSSLVLGCNGDLPKKEGKARGDKKKYKSNKRGDGFLSKGFKLKL